MNASTFESVIPYIDSYTNYREKSIKSISIPKEREFEGCEEACINLRNYFPTFHILPSRILENYELARSFKNPKKLDSQIHYIDHLKLFLSTKNYLFSRLYDFDLEEFLSQDSLDEMALYIGEKFRLSVERRKKFNKNAPINDLVEIIEKGFLTHAIWYMESCLTKETQKMHNFYKDSIGDQKKKVGEIERVYLRDTIASLTEYKNNLVSQYKFLVRKMAYGENHYPKDLEAIKLREIKKPFIKEEKETTAIGKIINKVKGFFNKLF